MGDIVTVTQEIAGFELKYILVDGEPWFKGKVVANALGYINTKLAILDHVENDDKKKMEELRGIVSLPLDYNTRNTIFINESGLYSLILKSNMPEAKRFQMWITKEVLPSIRKTGSYGQSPPPPPPPPLENFKFLNTDKIKEDNSINLYNEKELHIQVVKYIRKYHPHAMTVAGLGELQQTAGQRIEGKMKRYTKGSCDIMILNKHLDYAGMRIELKNPKGTGEISAEQQEWLQNMHLNNHMILSSNDYDEVTRELDKYFSRVRIACPFCLKQPQYFKSEKSLNKHISKFHWNRNP